MSKKHQDEGAIFVERSWPPLRFWGYVVLPVVILVIPIIFIGGDFRAVAVIAIGLWLLIVGLGSFMAAGRHWRITPDELSIDRVALLMRPFYGFWGERNIPLTYVQSVETLEGGTRAVEREAFGGRPPVKEAIGSCERFWCKEHVVVRLSQPDEYGETALLSTPRSQEASGVLIQAIKDDQQRRETAP